MAGNKFGNLFTISTYGESHGESLGVLLDGYPSGIKIDLDFIQNEMARRKPGTSDFTTARREDDKVEILSGIFEGKSTGCPILLNIKNKAQISKDYSTIKDAFRPGHADFTYYNKYGIRDYRGGGRSSGRETLARVAAGAFAKLYLKSKNIEIKAAISQICDIKANNDFTKDFDSTFSSSDLKAIEGFKKTILDAKKLKDSVGGIIECQIKGLPIGLGEPCFDKLEALLAHAILSIGACKGFEIGDGFSVCQSYGSSNNDKMYYSKDKAQFLSNHAGGVLGGISNGETVFFKAAFKPTPSIALKQSTVDINKDNVIIEVNGRHDPCIVPRAVVVVEAMSAIVIMDLYLMWKAYNE